MDALALTVSLCFLFVSVNGQCDQRPYGGKLKCCGGRDSDCYVQRRNNVTGEIERRICYCDSHCRFTNDCCEDAPRVRQLCRLARDCRVSNWGVWGKCSTTCGLGEMRRKRQVLQLPLAGGKPCPFSTQTRGCSDYAACTPSNTNSYSTAFILPISYRRPKIGSFMYENILPVPDPSIRFNDNPAYIIEESNNAPTYSYCVNFKLIFKQDGCSTTWASPLSTDTPICVECQSRVMNGGHCRGEGAMGIRTRWNALNIDRCYGEWIRLGPIIPNCSCSERYFSNYVFV